jgi:hypothetical protein
VPETDAISDQVRMINEAADKDPFSIQADTSKWYLQFHLTCDKLI